MKKAGLDEAQAGIKIARRNFNNLRYANDLPHPGIEPGASASQAYSLLSESPGLALKK